MPKPPTLWQSFRHTLGRAFRETGQALDRVAVKTAMLAHTKHDYYDDPVRFEDYLSRHRQLFPMLWSGRPIIDPQVAYVAPCATLIGSVRIGKESSVWYGAVLRADECLNADSWNKTTQELLEVPAEAAAWELAEERLTDRTHHHGGAIFIGSRTNIQDGCIVTSRAGHTRIGNGVTVGHLAQIHSATIEDFCLIGMGSIIQEGALIETESFVAAGAVIGPGQVVKTGELWVGNPARKLRDLTPEQRGKLHYQSNEYVGVALSQQQVMELGGNLSDSMIDRSIELQALEEGNATEESDQSSNQESDHTQDNEEPQRLKAG